MRKRIKYSSRRNPSSKLTVTKAVGSLTIATLSLTGLFVVLNELVKPKQESKQALKREVSEN